MARLYLLGSDNRLQAVDEQRYASEDLLQNLLARYPELLATGAEGEARLLLIRREAPVPDSGDSEGRWSLDHLFLDKNGVPTLVETKRSGDTRLRREVVGQMLDYAANCVSYWSVETIRKFFEDRCAKTGDDPVEMLAQFLDIAGEQRESEVERFWQNVKTNLAAERLRLVFVADEIPREVTRVIEFLDSQMAETEVIGIELRQFISAEGQRILAPHVVGRTARAEQRKSGGSPTPEVWTEESFLGKIANTSGSEAERVARTLLEWCHQRAIRVSWNNSELGSFGPEIRVGDVDHWPFLVGGGGNVRILFYSEARKFPFSDESKRREWLRRLNQIPGVQIGDESLNGKPKIPLHVLAEGSSLDQFLATITWMIDETRSAHLSH